MKSVSMFDKVNKVLNADKINVVLDEGAKLPTKAHSYDAGYDIYAKEDFTVPASKTVGMLWWEKVIVGCAVHDSGVHIEIPEGCVGYFKSKSGLNVKHGIISDGTIDAHYTGPLVVKLYNLTNKPYTFKAGEKITQLVIQPITMSELSVVDSLTETDRGNNGFGSSGK